LTSGNSASGNKIILSEIYISDIKISHGKAPRQKGPKGVPDPRVREILRAVEMRLGYPIAHWPKEAAAVKRGLRMGYTPEEILGCWETMRGFAFWKGRWLPMAKVVENLGAYREGTLREWRPPSAGAEMYRV
jgi:hypothetical protein